MRRILVDFSSDKGYHRIRAEGNFRLVKASRCHAGGESAHAPSDIQARVDVRTHNDILNVARNVLKRGIYPMHLSSFTLKNITCTLDFSTPQHTIFDHAGRVVDAYTTDHVGHSIKDHEQIAFIKDERGSSRIVISGRQYGQVNDHLDDIATFAEQFAVMYRRLPEIIESISVGRIGVRLFYQALIAEDGRFAKLLPLFDLPGKDDSRLRNLIHYNISLEDGARRIVITLGQSRQGNEVSLNPDLNAMYFGQVGIDDIAGYIVDLYDRAIAAYKSFYKES